MAVRRTLKQKQRAVVHRGQEVQYQYASKDLKTKSKKSDAPPEVAPKPVSQAEPSLSLKLFGYNPELVYNDLFRTLVVTLIVVAVLIAIFFSTR